MVRQDRFERRSEAAATHRERASSWWIWALAAAGIVASLPTLAQTGPAPVQPRSGSPTLPPSPGSGVAPQPRSENPLVGGGSVRPVPDRGVIVPPATGSVDTPIIKPPVSGSMPVIPPPGSDGGEKGVIPK